MKNRFTLFLFSLVLAVVFISCKEKSKATLQKEEKLSIVTDTTLIDGVLLELIDNNGKAELKIHSDAYTLTGELKITPPCYFLRLYGKGKVGDYSYPDIGVQHTLGILGNILSKEERKYTGLENEVSGERVQGLVFKKDSIILTDKILLGNVYFKNYGISQKDFWDLAHSGNE